MLPKVIIIKRKNENYEKLSDINTFLLKVDRHVSLRDGILSHRNSWDGKRKYG